MNSAMLIPVLAVTGGILLSGCSTTLSRNDSINYAYQNAPTTISSNYTGESSMTLAGGYNF